MERDERSFREEVGEWAHSAVVEAYQIHRVAPGGVFIGITGALPAPEDSFTSKVKWCYLAECLEAHAKPLCQKQLRKVRGWLEERGVRV